MSALHPARPRRPIGLTALIDVVFILLMFFMLTSGFSRWQLLEFNNASAAATPSPVTPALIVVHANGQLSLDRIAGEHQSATMLREVVALERPAVLIPTASTRLQTLVTAMNSLVAAGFDSLSVGRSVDLDRAVE